MIGKTQIGIKAIRRIAAYIRYGTKETITFFIAIVLSSAATWLIKSESEILKPYQDYLPLLGTALYIAAGLLAAWVVYRFVFRIAVPPPFDETRKLSHAIKGLMAFTQEDGELFRKLEREKEVTKLSSYVHDEQVPLVVIMGESGSGKTSLLRAGLSHILKDDDTTYIYWEALPTNPAESLLHTINSLLDTEFNDLSELLTAKQKAVIVLDQFEQLHPDNPKHTPIFTLLKQIATALPPHSITCFVVFRREYSAIWRDFEVDNQLYDLVPRSLSLKLFSIAQAQNVFITLAEEAGLILEQTLVNSFTQTVSHDDRLSPVDIGIGLLMLHELSSTHQLSLADYHFAGGSQGLFVSFLSSKIEERFPIKTEQESLFKALLELVDLKTNQRRAEGKTLKELTEKADGLSLKHLEFALNYFANSQVRMLEKVRGTDKIERFRLPHESMIPALRQLGSKILDKAAQINLKLETAYHFWQNTHKDKRYLLTGKDLKYVLQFKEQLDLRDKSEFLKLSVRKKKMMQLSATALIVILSITSSFGYNYVIELSYRNSLKDWGLPKDLRDYSEQLKILTINDADIRHLEWLDKFDNLITLNLDIRFSGVNDLSALKYLKELKELKNLTTLNLDLSYSKVSDISALKELKELKNLSKLVLKLSFSQVIDLSSLKELEKLTTLNLDLSFSGVSVLSALKELKELKNLSKLVLNLFYSQVIDPSALKELKKLTTLNLDLSFSNVSDISALKELKNLTTLNLNLSDSKVSDISALKELKNLTTLNLNLSDYKVSDINALKELKNLTALNLDLSDSKVSDISALKELKNLTTLNLNLSSSISNLSALKELKNLTTLTLDLSSSPVSDLSALNDVKAKEIKLDIRNTNIISLEGLPPTVTELAVGN